MARFKRDRKSSAAAQVAGPDDGRRPAGAEDRLRPWLLGVACALSVARPLYPSESAAMYGDGLPIVMLWIALAVFWLLGVIGRPAFRARFGWTDGAIVVLVVLHTVAAVWGATQGSPRPAVNMLWEWIAYALSFFMLRQLACGRRECRAVAAVMVATAMALAGHGLYQYFHQMPAKLAEYQKDPNLALRNEGMWYPEKSPERKLFEDRLRSTEPMASFALANSLAGYLAPWLVVLVGIGVGGGPWANGTAMPSRRRRWLRWLAVGGCVVLIAACLVLTKSRTAYLATLLGLLLVGGFCRREHVRIGWKLPVAAATVLAILFGAAIYVRGLDVEVLSEASKSLGYRVQYWRATLSLIADHALLGCGPGHFQDAYPAYKLPEAGEEVADPHSCLLEIWATAGTPTMLALLAVLVGFAVAVFRHHRRGLPASRENAAATSLAAQADRPFFVLAGLVLGFLLAVPAGLIGAAPPGLEVLWIGLPLAVLSLAILYPWVEHGELPGALPTIGLVVLLVNLSAAGGLGFPGVAVSLWVLLAVGLNERDCDDPRTVPRIVGVAGLMVMMTVAIACYASAYRPVLESQAAIRESQAAIRAAGENPIRRATHLQAAEAHLQAAAVADPLAVEPWLQLAALAFSQWQETPTRAAMVRFEQYTATTQRLAPQSSPVWSTAGDRYWDVFSQPGLDENAKREAIEKAVGAYGRAVDLYPNSGILRARFARALHAYGDDAGFREQGRMALELDDLTPHLDKKLDRIDKQLADELRNHLPRNTSRRN